MIELYAIIDHPGPPLPLPGIAPLRSVAQDRLAFVYAPAREAKVSPEFLWHHERVMEALMEGRDLLPVRYGTRLADEGAARRALADRQDELANALDRVRDAVELSMRVLGEREGAMPAVEVRNGMDYVRAKVRATAAQNSVVQRVHKPLSQLSRSTMQRSPRANGELLRTAYLVDRTAVQEFVDRVVELQDTGPELRLLCTGPWPPYSFSEP